MSRTLVTMLGKARESKDTGYRETTYRFPNGTEGEAGRLNAGSEGRPSARCLFGLMPVWNEPSHRPPAARAGAAALPRGRPPLEAAFPFRPTGTGEDGRAAKHPPPWRNRHATASAATGRSCLPISTSRTREGASGRVVSATLPVGSPGEGRDILHPMSEERIDGRGRPPAGNADLLAATGAHKLGIPPSEHGCRSR